MQPTRTQTTEGHSYKVMWKATLIGVLFGLLLPAVFALASIGGSFAIWAVPAGRLALWAVPHGAIGGLTVGLVILFMKGRRPFLYGSISGVLYGTIVDLLTWGHIQGAIPILSALAGTVIALFVKVPGSTSTQHEDSGST